MQIRMKENLTKEELAILLEIANFEIEALRKDLLAAQETIGDQALTILGLERNNRQLSLVAGEGV